MEETPQEIERRLPGARIIRRPRTRKLAGLRRVLGVPALYSTAYGNVGSSIYYALGVTALSALGLTPAVFMLAGIVFAFTALSYAEGTAAIPEAGGSSSFARHAFNDLVSFVAGWALMLDYIITIGISAFTVPGYLAAFAPMLKVYPWNALGGAAVIGALMIINVVGVKETARLNISLAVLDLFTQLLLVILGGFLLFQPDILMSNVRWGVAPTWNQLIYGISIAMIAYTGIETVANMSEEAANPARDVPRSIILVFISVLAIYAGISVIALSAMPVYQLADGTWTTDLATKYLTDPVLGIAVNLPATISAFLKPWIGILAATILVIATNAGVIGVSRLAFSMGGHQQLPPALSKVHRRFRTPYTAIIAFCVVAVLLILPGKITFLAELYSFGAMLAFTMAHISIIALRIRRPDMPRPYRIPLNIRLGTVSLPVTAILGATATFGTWLVVVYTHPWGRIVGFAWLAVGGLLYVLYRRSQELPLTHTLQHTTTP